ncbi:MAG: ABC transporter ATP-binding protein [Mycoplasmatales bacterium]
MKVIEVKNVTKVYQLYKHPRDTFLELLTFRERHSKKTVLNNISFTVNAGDTFGVLGANGSGKSTILSIINGTTFPTEGEVVTRGTVSLLNVGAGIVAGYTGYENITYKCRLMGLSKKEVAEIYDDIVEFSELDDEYLSQPVRKYSSGMKAKLGFSISVHISPDILIVDEALAVGDQRFQDKCHKKIREKQAEGMTILYVSHSHGAVKNICDHCIWIDQGLIIAEGDSAYVCDLYAKYMNNEITVEQARKTFLSQMQRAKIDAVLETSTVKKGKTIKIVEEENYPLRKERPKRMKREKNGK